MVGNGDNWLGFLSKPPRMQNSTELATIFPIHWPSHPFLKDALPLHGNDLRARLRNALCGDAKEIPCKAALGCFRTSARSAQPSSNVTRSIQKLKRQARVRNLQLTVTTLTAAIDHAGLYNCCYSILFCDTQARSRCRFASLDTPNPVHKDMYVYRERERV